MNREIKFRGKRLDNGEWVYGNLVIDSDESNYSIIDYAVSKTNTYTWHDVIPETVGQYIGKKDTNGKEIWEGDIVKIAENKLPNEVKPFGEVKWLDTCSKFIFGREYEKGNCGFIIEPWTKCEIVESKFQNPNLLKQKK